MLKPRPGTANKADDGASRAAYVRAASIMLAASEPAGAVSISMMASRSAMGI